MKSTRLPTRAPATEIAISFLPISMSRAPAFTFADQIGFYINLFNLIPFGMLDGGWILAPVSKWLQVVGLALLGASVIFIGFSPILIILVLLGIPTLWNRFRNPALDAYYGAVPKAARYGMGLAWLALVVYLGFASFEAHKLLGSIVR